jgi:hypothetical protein
MKTRVFQNSWVIFLVYTVLTLLFTWPLIVQVNQSLYGYEILGYHYDPFGTMEKFLSIKTQFLQQKKLFLSPYTYPGTDYPGAILTALSNEVAAFNILLLLSFPLSGLFAYLLAYHLTQNRLAAFWGGLLYAFSPYHWIHAYYHLGIAQIQWFPLYLWCLFLFMETPDWKRALGLVMSLFLLVFSNFYYSFFALILTTVFLLFYGFYFAWPFQNKSLSVKGFWRLLAGMALAGGVLIFLLFQNLTLIYRHLAMFSVSYQDLIRFGSRPWGFVLPPLDNPLLGWIGKDYILTHREAGLVEHTLYLGLVPVLLSLLTMWGWLRKKEGFFSVRFKQAIPFFVVLIGVSLLCSRPPVMTLWGFEFYLPSHYLYSLFPMFRCYARLGLLVYLSLAVLAAGGLAFVSRKRNPVWVFGLAFILLFVEYTNRPPERIRPILPTEAHRWLAGHSSKALIVDYSKDNLANISPVGRLLKNTLLPKTEMEAFNLFDFTDLQKTFRTVQAIGGQYIIVPRSLEPIVRGRGMDPVQIFSDSILFKVPPVGEPVVPK